jgi:nitronate monooxygenase
MHKSGWQTTRLTNLINIRVPIVQGPFGGGYSSVELTATVSNLGGLGSFGLQSYNAAEMVAYIRSIRSQTAKPFNVNLWVDNRDERLSSYDENAYQQLKAIFKPYFDKFDLPMPEMPVDLLPEFENQVQAILDEKPPVFSFVYGIPSGEILEQCRKNGIITVGNATTVDEAVALENAGVDAVVATGFEAGGHRVSFLQAAEESLMGLFSLVPQVADAVKIPVIAAGGIADARGIKAALTLGADAVQIGTAFLATEQSNATLAHKHKLFSNDARYTTLTKIFSGRLARGIRSILTDEIKIGDAVLAPYPMQGKFIGHLRSEALKKDKADYISFWSGQSAALLSHRDATELFNALVRDTDALCSGLMR